MSTLAFARLCAEAVADLTAGGVPGEVVTWITDGGGTAAPDEVTAVLELLALRTGLVAAVRARQRPQVRLWRLSAAGGRAPGAVRVLAAPGRSRNHPKEARV